MGSVDPLPFAWKGGLLGNNSFLLLGWNSRVCFQVDIVLHIPLLCGDVPDGTSSGTGTRGRENGHTQDTNEISITD